ncbi:sperm axonemal maintenance protein CFAP97D1-like, partial [Petromyzon marinus]|uniref:sperm axonemal maintenance protein CFAP97D1-like n=1 Tax=Petromyzon marinus TaxID=7757 RepID=UPI003F71D6D8
ITRDIHVVASELSVRLAACSQCDKTSPRSPILVEFELIHASLKVLSAKPVVDTSSPRTCGHLNTRSKKMQAQEERVAAIEHENRALLGRMAHIAGTGGRLDHRNSYVARSLNGEQRGRELERLARENQALLMRLQKSKPSYSAQQWEQQWLRSQQITSNISRFPRGGGGGGGGGCGGGGCGQVRRRRRFSHPVP